MFYEACLAGGVDEETAELMYSAVYTYGPRWGGAEARALIEPSEPELRTLKTNLARKRQPGRRLLLKELEEEAEKLRVR